MISIVLFLERERQQWLQRRWNEGRAFECRDVRDEQRGKGQCLSEDRSGKTVNEQPTAKFIGTSHCVPHRLFLQQLREKLTGRRYGVPLQLSHREVIATGGHRSAFFVKLPSFHSGDTEWVLTLITIPLWFWSVNGSKRCMIKQKVRQSNWCFKESITLNLKVYSEYYLTYSLGQYSLVMQHALLSNLISASLKCEYKSWTSLVLHVFGGIVAKKEKKYPMQFITDWCLVESQ